MTTLHDELAALQAHAAHDFTTTDLSRDLSPIRRRVRRDRGVAYAAGTLAVAGLGGGTVFAAMLGGGGASVAPAAESPSASTSASASVPDPTAETAGSPSLALTTKMTVYPGDTLATLIPQLAEAFQVQEAVVQRALNDAAPDGNAEGWIYPSDYEFAAGMSLAQATQAMVGSRAFDLEERGVSDEDANEVLTLASLIESETTSGDPEDMALVSAVLQNRLASEMQLQLDSTVLYLTGSEGPFTTDEERATDSPYNTYLYRGLPPGPVSTPSDDAIDAALNPAESDYLYYVTTNVTTGEMRFARTYEEHLANVQRLQEWYAMNEG